MNNEIDVEKILKECKELLDSMKTGEDFFKEVLALDFEKEKEETKNKIAEKAVKNHNEIVKKSNKMNFTSFDFLPQQQLGCFIFGKIEKMGIYITYNECKKQYIYRTMSDDMICAKRRFLDYVMNYFDTI